VAVFFLAAPAIGDFAHALGNQKTYANLHERFLPKSSWFNIPYGRHVESASQQDGRKSDDALTTGSVKSK
jgi:hypothetical protein